MTVGQIAHEAVTTTTGESVVDTAETMDAENIDVLVVEENGAVEGIVTDREVALMVADTEATYRTSPLRT
jgi:CBS domain-containing protein